MIQVQNGKLVPIYGDSGFINKPTIRCRRGASADSRTAASRGRAAIGHAVRCRYSLNGILLGGLYGADGARHGAGLGRAQHRQSRPRRLHHAGRLRRLFPVHRCGIDPFVALPIAMLAHVLRSAIALQRGLLNLIVRSAMLNTLLITFGLDVVLTYLAQLLFSADFRTINPTYAGANFSCSAVTRAGGAARRVRRRPGCCARHCGCFCCVPRLGRAIRATRAESRRRAALRRRSAPPLRRSPSASARRWPAPRAASTAWSRRSLPISAAPLTAKSFVIAIIGGLDNPLGVIVGGLVLGVAESLTALYLGPTYTDVGSFGMLVLVLVVRPDAACWRQDGMKPRARLLAGRRRAGRCSPRCRGSASPMLIQFGINALLLADAGADPGTSSAATPAMPPSATRCSTASAPTAPPSPWSSSTCPSGSAWRSGAVLAVAVRAFCSACRCCACAAITSPSRPWAWPQAMARDRLQLEIAGAQYRPDPAAAHAATRCSTSCRWRCWCWRR